MCVFSIYKTYTEPTETVHMELLVMMCSVVILWVTLLSCEKIVWAYNYKLMFTQDFDTNLCSLTEDLLMYARDFKCFVRLIREIIVLNACGTI